MIPSGASQPCNACRPVQEQAGVRICKAHARAREHIDWQQQTNRSRALAIITLGTACLGTKACGRCWLTTSQQQKAEGQHCDGGWHDQSRGLSRLRAWLGLS